MKQSCSLHASLDTKSVCTLARLLGPCFKTGQVRVVIICQVTSREAHENMCKQCMITAGAYITSHKCTCIFIQQFHMKSVQSKPVRTLSGAEHNAKHTTTRKTCQLMQRHYYYNPHLRLQSANAGFVFLFSKSFSHFPHGTCAS